MAVKKGNGDEITNVVIDSLEKLDAAEEAFRAAFAHLRSKLT